MEWWNRWEIGRRNICRKYLDLRNVNYLLQNNHSHHLKNLSLRNLKNPNLLTEEEKRFLYFTGFILLTRFILLTLNLPHHPQYPEYCESWCSDSTICLHFIFLEFLPMYSNFTEDIRWYWGYIWSFLLRNRFKNPNDTHTKNLWVQHLLHQEEQNLPCILLYWHRTCRKIEYFLFPADT